MKKIMFNDKYGLTDAVLEGRKTQTRRVMSEVDKQRILFDGWYAKYKVGEVVAVAQKYEDFYSFFVGLPENVKKVSLKNKGWVNKMFVKAELMPHHIRITNIRVENLQDISDEDCLKEGIIKLYFEKDYEYGYGFFGCPLEKFLCTPRDAFLTLIDKVSGKGTWESNPWVFVYDFELVD